MNDKDNAKSGIETLLDDVDILTILEREKMRRIFESKIAGLENENDELRNLQKRAGKAAAARFDNLREFCFKVYTDQCLSALTPKPLISNLSSASRDEREKIFTLLRPSFKVFAAEFHRLAGNEKWSENESYWLTTAAAKAKTDTTLHRWWKRRNKALKVVLEAAPNNQIDD